MRARTAGLTAVGNHAGQDGGGVHVDNGVCDLIHGTLAHNSAARNRGGLSLNLFASVTMHLTNCTNNLASENGGGVSSKMFSRLVAGD